MRHINFFLGVQNGVFWVGAKKFMLKKFMCFFGPLFWSAANGGLRDGGLRKSEENGGKRPFSSVFWISQVLFAPSGKGRKRQKKGEKGRFRLISGKGSQTPLKPPFVTPPFAAAQLFMGRDDRKSTTYFYTEQMDAEGLGRGLLLTPLGTPRKSLKSRL